jgi:hypothetical protein
MQVIQQLSCFSSLGAHKSQLCTVNIEIVFVVALASAGRAFLAWANPLRVFGPTLFWTSLITRARESIILTTSHDSQVN